MSADLAVVVVTHNAERRVTATLDALDRDPERARWDVVVVDNASTDGTPDTLRRRRVRVLRNDVGRGYAGALNQGTAATASPSIAFMTAGTIPPAGALATLAAALDDGPRIAAVGPLIRHADGRVQRHGLFRPGPYTAFVVLSGLASFAPFRGEAKRYYGPHEPGPALDVDQLTGACLVVRRAALDDVGPFDADRFFVYCEDVDWSLRARSRGWRLRFVPSVEVRREKSSTSRTESSATIHLYYRSLRRFYDKHAASGDGPPVRAVMHAASYVKESLALASNALRKEKGLRY